MSRATLIGKWRHVVASIVLGMLLASGANAADPISTAYCVDCVPFQFQDENGEPAGLIIDLWRLWSEKTGIEIDFRPGQWDETLRMVRDGQVEAHAGLFYNDERAQYLDYGSYLTNTETHFFIKKGLPAIEIVEDLAAFRVGVLAGDYVEGWLAERLPEGTVIGFESYDAIMAALRGGQLQVFAADSPTGIFHLQRSGLGFSYEYPEDRPLYQTDWLVAAKKGNTELIKIIDLGLALISDEERAEIEGRWIAVEAKGFELSRRDMAIIAALLVAAAVIGIVIWSVSLRRQIAVRTRELLAANQTSAAAEALLRDAIDNMSDGFVVYDSDDRLVTCNQNWKDIYRYSDDEAAPGTAYKDLIRLDLAKGLIAEEGGQAEAYEARRFAYRKELASDFEVRFADGRWISYHEELTSTGGRVAIQRDVTERKEAEDEVRASEARLLSILEASPLGVTVTRADGAALFVNPRAIEMLGHTADELLTTGATALYRDPADRERYVAALEADGTVRNFEVEMQHSDGTIIWVMLAADVIEYDGGPAYLSWLYDITERRQVEQALSESQARFTEAAQQAHLGHWVYDEVADRLIYCSEEMAHIHGTTPEAYLELVSSTENDIERVHPDDRERYGEVIRDVARDAADYDVEYRIIRVDGEVRHLRELGVSDTDDEGRLVSSRGTIQDITDRKQAEDELRAANEASAAAQTRLLDAIESLPAAFVLYDADDRLLLCNARFRNLYSYSKKEAAVGVNHGDLYKLDVERGNVAADVDEQDYFKQRVSARREHEGVTEVQFANQRWLEMHERPTSEGGLVSIQVDITKRHEAEVALRESEERFALAVEGANDGLWDWNLLNDQTYISPTMRHLLGLEKETEDLSVEDWRARIHPDDIETVKSKAQAHLQGGAVHAGYLSIFNILPYRSGQPSGALL